MSLREADKAQQITN